MLQRYGVPFHPENGQIRCLAHVVNLIVQRILKELLEVNEDPDDNDYFLLNKQLPIHYDPDYDEDLTAMEGQDAALADNENSEAELESDIEDAPDMEGVRTPVQKVHKHTFTQLPADDDIIQLRIICRKIVSSPQRRSAFRRLAKKHYIGKKVNDNGRDISELMVIRDVRTRWNYTLAMIERALIMRKVYSFRICTFETRFSLKINSGC